MRITRDITGGLAEHGFTGKCFVCLDPASAVWMGAGSGVEVCGRCAVEVLPKLLADAVDVPLGVHTAGYDRAWERATACYWKGVAAKVADEVRRLAERAEGGDLGAAHRLANIGHASCISPEAERALAGLVERAKRYAVLRDVERHHASGTPGATAE